MRIVFWQNMPTHHQAPCIRELAADRQNQVRVHIEEPIPDWRKASGWLFPDYGDAHVKVGIGSDTLVDISSADRDSIHVFSGIGAYPGVHAAFKAAARSRVRIGVMSEASAQKGSLVVLRFLKTALNLARYRGRVDFILGIGADAPGWFGSTGFERSRVFPYAYFVDGSGPQQQCRRPNGQAVRLIFVGRLVKLKGVDFLLRTLAQITNQTWELRIAGGGPEANRLLTLRDQLGIRDRVAFLGCLPNPEVIRAIQSSDVLVLPSRGDGWGAVINEALCAGVPVLCSDRCGARALIQTPIQGEVFRSDCTKDLHAALVRWTRTPLGDGHRARLALWARSLTGQSGAAYLTRILRHIYEAGPLPRPPWCEV